MSASPGAPAIRLKGVSKSFGAKKVLIGLDLEVKKGESLVLLGQSGIGKSVLLKHVIGLLKPDSGTVELEGVDLWAASPRERDELRRKFGMSFQEGALFDSMSVGENIAFPLTRHTKKSKKEIAERVAECLELVRLPGIEEKRPSELSGGMKRRVGFARAIALQPENLLFDEPTTGLDPVTTDVVVKVIEDMRKRLKPAAITITHDLKVAFAIADRVGLLSGGKIYVEMTARRIELDGDNELPGFQLSLTGTGKDVGTRRSVAVELDVLDPLAAANDLVGRNHDLPDVGISLTEMFVEIIDAIA